MAKCPLCQHLNPNVFYSDRDRTYFQCPNCALIFVARDDLLSAREEKARYDLHQNNPDDLGYRQFLSQLSQPLINRLGPPPAHGLDFGSGPEPAFALMLKEQGYAMTCYDPYYAPDTAPLQTTYDFVTCTETFEHFYHPGEEWNLLLSLLKPYGWLGIMTKLIDHLDQFPKLHYINDLTHVSFYSRKTFQFMAQKENIAVEFIGDNVILMQKVFRKPNPQEDAPND
jgi:hypothetical protein